jgi:hypothetical protein
MFLEWEGCHHLVSFIHHDPKPRRRLAVNVCPDLAVEIIFVDHAGTAIRIHPAKTIPHRLTDQGTQTILRDTGLKFAGSRRRGIRPMTFHDVAESLFRQHDFAGWPVWLIGSRRWLATDKQEQHRQQVTKSWIIHIKSGPTVRGGDFFSRQDAQSKGKKISRQDAKAQRKEEKSIED